MIPVLQDAVPAAGIAAGIGDVTGELAALGTAVAFAVCSLLFAAAGRRVGALGVNLLRILAALVVLLAIHVALHGAPWPAASGRQWVLLLASGLVGLALGDLALFHCFAVCGPRLGTLLMATTPALTTVLAWVVLDEVLGVQALVGIVTITLGVALVLARGQGSWTPPVGREGGRGFALACGLLAALGQAGGLILAKRGMFPGGPDEVAVAPLAVTLVRMAAGAAGTLTIAACLGRLGTLRRVFADRRALGGTLAGTAFGPVLGVWLSIVAVELAEAGVAAALMALTPVLLLPAARILHGDRPGAAGLLGTLAAFGGVLLLVWR